MATTTTRLVPGLLAGGLLLLPLAGCSGNSNNASTPSSVSSEASSAASSASSAASSAANNTSGSASAGSSGAGVSGSAGSVNCSGTTCTATLSPQQKSVSVLGQTISLTTVQNGTATISVAGQSISCTQGQTVSLGPASFTCSNVTDNGVTLTASLGGAGASSSVSASPTS